MQNVTNRHCLTEPHMNTLSRRQRDFMQREQLFLDTARMIIRNDGVGNLTMDRIAELTEYAKGTVYKHFTCKEDMLCALCLECMQTMVGLFERANQTDGPPRLRIMAIGIAYQVFSLRFPEEFDLLLSMRTNNIRQKAAAKRIADVDVADQSIHNLLRSVVNDAIANGDLTLPPHIQIDELCFSLWAMSFGMMALDQSQDLLAQLQLPPVQQVIYNQLTLLLDSYRWQPLSQEFDYIKSYQHILQQLEGNS